MNIITILDNLGICPRRSTVSKSHRQGERDSGSSEHQRVGKRGSSGDSSRGESDKEGGGGEPPPPTWVKKSGPRNASSSTANSTSNERVSSSSPLPLTTGGGGHVTSRLVVSTLYDYANYMQLIFEITCVSRGVVK